MSNHLRSSAGAPVSAITYSQLSVTQPLTQLWRIRQAQHLASAQTASAAAQRARVEADVRVAIERLYASVLIGRARAQAAQLAWQAARRQNEDLQRAVVAGIEVPARGLGATASALDAELAWIAAKDSVADGESELRSALALPRGTQLELVVPESPSDALLPLDRIVASAMTTSPDVAAARAGVDQARHASSLAAADYIPDLGVGVTYTMVDGLSFLPRRAAGLSIQGSWTAFDWGKRGAVVRERAAQEQAASTELTLARDRVTVEVERAYRSVVRAERGVEIARAALEARRASLDVARDRCARGLAATAVLAIAEAEYAESEAQNLAAGLQVRLARAALTRASGG